MLPEFELNIEPEEGDDLKLAESDAEAEARRQATGKELEKKVDGVSSMEETELLQYASADEDVMFGKFKKRIAGNNDQVNSFFVCF